MRKITDRQKQHAILLYQNTKLDGETIADIINISQPSLYKILKGITNRRRNTFPKSSIEQAVQMYVDEYKVSEISEMTLVPESRLYKELEARKISRRRAFFARNSTPKVDEQEVLRLYEIGNSTIKIANKLNVKWKVIDKVVSKAIKDGKVSETNYYINHKKEEECMDAIAELLIARDEYVNIEKLANLLCISAKSIYYKIDKCKKQKKEENNHEREGE